MSQVTKPIALDETLQDVVTAIQGITQGGMIVATGNVGSATQPVYIDGGVPTAMTGALETANGGTGDTKGRAVGTYIPSTSDADVDMSATGNYARASRVDVVDSGHLPTSNWYLVNTLHGGATGSAYGVQLALQMTGSNDIVAYRRYVSGAWTDWKYLNGITTGTPTNINSNCSFDSGRVEVKKAGNVVDFNVRLVVDTGFTPIEMTELYTLPFKPTTTWRLGFRMSGSTGNCVLGYVEIDKNTGKVIWGTAPNQQLTAGMKIWTQGTYLTND